MTLLLIDYVCHDCDTHWTEEGDCPCEDRCPVCNAPTEPESYTEQEDVTVVPSPTKEERLDIARKLLGDMEAALAEVTALKPGGYVVGWPEYHLFVPADSNTGQATGIRFARVWSGPEQIPSIVLTSRNGKGERAKVLTVAEAREGAMRSLKDTCRNVRDMIEQIEKGE